MTIIYCNIIGVKRPTHTVVGAPTAVACPVVEGGGSTIEAVVFLRVSETELLSATHLRNAVVSGSVFSAQFSVSVHNTIIVAPRRDALTHSDNSAKATS